MMGAQITSLLVVEVDGWNEERRLTPLGVVDPVPVRHVSKAVKGKKRDCHLAGRFAVLRKALDWEGTAV